MFFAPTVRTTRYVPRSFDRNFERFVNDAFFGSARTPKVEQDDTRWTLTLDVPGLAREELGITIEDTVVRIQSTAEAKRQVKAAYELPQPIDAANSQAKLENGVLTLTLGKQKTVNNVTQIVIN